MSRTRRLFNAGAIMHIRTTTPEFAYAAVTHSRLWGITRNPWNLEFSPGGSSGGAGAAVASGMTTLADGTDGGGSVRIPAFSGIFGLKTTKGRWPTDGVAPLCRTLDTIGLKKNRLGAVRSWNGSF